MVLTWGFGESVTCQFPRNGGLTLPQAIEGRKGQLPPYYASLVTAGVRTGRLPDVLATLTAYAHPLCRPADHMGKMIQIRNVPDALHRKLKARAAEAGMSLSDYLLREVRKTAERPTMEELLERLKRLPPVEVNESPADVLRSERERRDRR